MSLTIAETGAYDLVQQTFRTWETIGHPLKELVLQKSSSPGKAKEGAT